MPAPKLVLDEDVWGCKSVLPSWKGFQTRNGPYGALSSKNPSDGLTRIVFAPEGRGIKPLSKRESALVRWFFDHEAEVSAATLKYLLTEYPRLQIEYGYKGRERARLMPAVSAEAGFKKLIGVHSVNIHQVDADGVPYVGFEFGCTWDDEHGLGVLMHGTETVEIGDADTAILLWIAEQHAEEADA